MSMNLCYQSQNHLITYVPEISLFLPRLLGMI